MINRINYKLVGAVAFAVLATLVFLGVSFNASAQELPKLPKYPFKLTKNISDNYTPDPYTADEFRFNVSGYGEVVLDAFTDDTAEKVIYLSIGTYTVEEIGPTGFVPANWTVQWSGHGCTGDTGNGPIRPIGITVVEATDPDAGGNVCRADNQWRPEENPSYEQGSYYAQSSYSQYTQSSYGGGYSQGSYGGGGENTYLVFGYVWHDENESDIWEKEQENPDDNEVDLDAWTVQITDGETTYSTTTDPTGYYYFYVPVGTWTISEVLQSEWNQTYPNETTHTVVVTGPITQAESGNFFATLVSYFTPTAFAQSPTTYGPFDFGNVFKGGSSYSQASYSGSYSQGSYGGGGGSSSSGSKRKKKTPEPEVLGEATSAMPAGAPNTGAGGTSPVAPTLPSLLAILSPVARVRHS